jgi:anti-sigma factor ChrR (cupin superfamily)
MSRSEIEAPIPDDILGELLVALDPKSMPKKREAAIKQTLLQRISAPSQSSHRVEIITVRATSGKWTPWLPGIDTQLLFDDGRTMSWLVRFAPGARMAAHDHHDDEESTVVQGSCYAGEMHLKQGDYQLARRGSRHGEIFSPEGCVLLMRTASVNAQQMKAITDALRV